MAVSNDWKALPELSFFKVEYRFFAEGYVFGKEIVEVVVDSRIIHSATKTSK